MVYHWGMNKFLLIGRGINQGWWLLIETQTQFAAVHQSVTSGLFLKFLENPHFEKAYPGQSAVTLAQKWLTTAEMIFNRKVGLVVNRAGGMMNWSKHLDVIETRECEGLRFPANDIEKRKITVSRWFGGEHFYLQCDHQVVFSQPKFDLLDDAMREARAYALEENITVADAKFIYTSEGG